MSPYRTFVLSWSATLAAGMLAIWPGGTSVLPSLLGQPLPGLLRLQIVCTVGLAVIMGAVLLAAVRAHRRTKHAMAESAQALHKARHHIEETYDHTLAALAQAIDLRDHETEGHSLRVTAYSLALASALGHDGTPLLELARGALLHDIGKLGIPDSILLKPGPLDESEWLAMRRHPELGYRLLSGVSFLHSSIPVVLQHHERFDGKGYPAGLSGERISPLARLFAVADSFDAMTSDRPYRRGMPYPQARDEIARGRGTQFDPRVVDAFLAMPPEHWHRIAAEAAHVRSKGGLRRLLGGGVSCTAALAAVARQRPFAG